MTLPETKSSRPFLSPAVSVTEWSEGGQPVELIEDLMVALHGALIQLATLGVEAAPLDGDPKAVAAWEQELVSGETE